MDKLRGVFETQHSFLFMNKILFIIGLIQKIIATVIAIGIVKLLGWL